MNLKQAAAEALDPTAPEGVYQVAQYAADNAGSSVGAQDVADAAEWLGVWKNSVEAMLAYPGCYSFIDAAVVAFFAERGIAA